MLRKCRYSGPDADDGNREICGGCGFSHTWRLEKELGGPLRFVVIVEGAGFRESQSLSQYLSTLGRQWNHMSHAWLSVPTKLIDEKTTCVAIKEGAPKSLVRVLGPADEAGVAEELLSDKQGRDWLVNRWGPLNG
jgi:hypothetical protein